MAPTGLSRIYHAFMHRFFYKAYANISIVFCDLLQFSVDPQTSPHRSHSGGAIVIGYCAQDPPGSPPVDVLVGVSSRVSTPFYHNTKLLPRPTLDMVPSRSQRWQTLWWRLSCDLLERFSSFMDCCYYWRSSQSPTLPQTTPVRSRVAT